MEALSIRQEYITNFLLVHGFDGNLDPAVLVLAQNHYTEGALSNLAQKLVLLYAVLLSEALLAKNFSMPHLERFTTVEVDRSLLGGRGDECEAVGARLGPIFKRTYSALFAARALEAGQGVA